MKTCLFFIAIFICIGITTETASAQTTYTWTPALGSTDYAAATNWNPARAVPAASDVLVIDGAITPSPTITNLQAQTVARLRVINGANTTMSALAAITLAVAGDGNAATPDFEIDSTSFLILSGSNAIAISLSAGASGSAAGQMTVTGGAHRLTGSTANAITFLSAGVFTTGPGFTGGAFGATPSGAVVFAGGSQYVHNAGASPFPVSIFQPGSTAVYRTGTGFSASGRTYANLTIDNNTIISSTGANNFQFQTLDVKSGSAFSHAASGSASVTITGDLKSAGIGSISITSGSGGIQINSGSTQTFGGGGGTGSITFGSSAIISAGTTVDLARVLTISSGVLTVNGNLTRTSNIGYIIGNLNQPFTAPVTRIFEVGTSNGYSPVTVTATTGAFPQDFTIKAVQGKHPNIQGTNALGRYWILTANGITADLVFQYLASDVTGDEASYIIIKFDGTFTFPGGTVNTGNHTAMITGQSSFSDWTLSEPAAPTIVELISFAAKSFDGGTLLEWRTGFEVENLGFNIYREQAGKRVLVNKSIIAGSALLAGPRTPVTAGLSYSWWDTEATNDRPARYWLEDIDIGGKKTLSGPVTPQVSFGKHLASARAPLLADLEKRPSKIRAVASERELIARPISSTASLETQWELAAEKSVKISIREEGWYRVTQAELVAAGLDAEADPRRLSLYLNGEEQAILVDSHNGNRFEPGDAIEFYGAGLDTPSTDSRTYWLVEGKKSGKRINVTKSPAQSGGARSFLHTLECKERSTYFSGLKNGDAENWFGPVILNQLVNQGLTLAHLDTMAAGDAQLEVALQGVSDLPEVSPDHLVKVKVNGTEIGAIKYDGQSWRSERLAFAQSLLREGANIITLVAEDSARDVSLLDYLRLSYWHSYTVDADELRMTIGAAPDGHQSQTIDGFSNPKIRLIDITHMDQIEELVGQINRQGSGFSISIRNLSPAPRTLLALTEDQIKRPEKIASNQPSDWHRRGNAASLVIISHQDFASALAPLKTLRESQGYTVATIDVEDLYDEFSYGEKSPRAIKDFLRLASTSWRTRPRFVLFVGDSSLDPRNYLGSGDPDFVPTKFLDTSFMETASDDWFADFAGNGLASIATGRLPVKTLDETRAIISKILSYEKSPQDANKQVMLVADRNDGFDFEAAARKLKHLLPGEVSVQEVFRGQMDDQTARALVIEGINQGRAIINYSGHGSFDLWRGGLLTSQDPAEFVNRDRLAFFVSMNCLNGFFQDPFEDSISEALLKATRGGAVAVWASSGFTTPYAQSLMNEELYRLLFDQGAPPITLGEATSRAKSAIVDLDVRRTWVFLGDPTTRLRQD